MKMMIKNGLVAAALMLAVAVSASGTELPVKVAVSGERSIGLFINEISNKVWISLRDEDGQVIYSKTLKGQKNYAVEYDLRNLPDGSYTVEFEDANLRKAVHLVIMEGKVAISNPVAQVVKK